MQFEGIYTPLVTPYNKDFSLNEQALEATVEHLISAGVHGIIVAGTTGEYYAQSMDERIEMIARVRKLIKSRVPMIVAAPPIFAPSRKVQVRRTASICWPAITPISVFLAGWTIKRLSFSHGARDLGSVQGPTSHLRRI